MGILSASLGPSVGEEPAMEKMIAVACAFVVLLQYASLNGVTAKPVGESEMIKVLAKMLHETQVKIYDSRWKELHRDVMAVCTQHTWGWGYRQGVDYVMPLKRGMNCQQMCQKGLGGICFGHVQLNVKGKQSGGYSNYVATSYIINSDKSCKLSYDANGSKDYFEDEASLDIPDSYYGPHYCCCGFQGHPMKK